MANQIVDLFNFISETVFNFRLSYQGQVLKNIFIFYSGVIFLCLFLLIRKYPNLWDYAFRGNKKKKKENAETSIKLPGSTWDKIKFKLRSINPNDWKIAVIEADKALDDTLRQKGISGQTMGDRLKNVSEAEFLEELNNIWEAHKTRNSIVHDPVFEITNSAAERAVFVLEKATRIIEK